MRLVLVPLLATMLFASGCGASGDHVVAANGVRFTVPRGWDRVRSGPDRVEPRTLLAVGTAGVRATPSPCASTLYRLPRAGAAVAVVGWSSIASAGGAPRPGRAPLARLVAVRRRTFECFAGRGAAADLLLAGKRYQVRVLVGDGASADRVRQALAAARSFEAVG